MYADVFKHFKQHCMTGISYMIPVIVIGGFCTAIARLFGDVETAGTFGYAFIQAGNAAFALMMGVLCAGIAYSICGKPGIAPGIVAGYLSNQVKASFLGALVCGFLIGLMILWMQNVFPKSNVSDRYLSGTVRNRCDRGHYVLGWPTIGCINCLFSRCIYGNERNV